MSQWMSSLLAPVAGLSGAMLLALSGAPHCAAMCGPFASGALQRTPATPAGRLAAPAWHTGRIVAYSALGAISGAVGDVRILNVPAGPVLTLVALVWMAARVAGLPLPRFPVPRGPLFDVAIRLAARGDLPGRFLFGMLAATLPCGLLWSGLALAAVAGSPAGGALVMAGFFVGTLPALVVAARLLSVAASARPASRRIAAGIVLSVGVWSVALRAGWLTNAEATASVPCHGPVVASSAP